VVDPKIMGHRAGAGHQESDGGDGPFLADMDVIEINEAFAAQVIAANVR